MSHQLYCWIGYTVQVLKLTKKDGCSSLYCIFNKFLTVFKVQLDDCISIYKQNNIFREQGQLNANGVL